MGSTSYITTRNGSISQHVEYIAFGEILFEEHSSSFSSPYLFNGKELDRETNLSYYGARYLDMKTSLWLSVDPKMEKYLNEGPYIYCGDNPIAFVDPDGMDRIYSATGHFLEDNHNGSNLIRVRIGGINYRLSQLDYKSIGTQRAVRNIVGTEAKFSGYGGRFGVKKLKEAGAQTENGKDVFINTKSLEKGDYDDYNTLRNVISHETDLVFGHRGETNHERQFYTYLAHANVYLGQSKTNDFKNTTIENQYTTAVGFAERIFASTQKESGLNINEEIKNYNENNGVVKIEKIDANTGSATFNIDGHSDTIKLKIPKTPYD
nr:RHS repeat-associated core domain-containing protein [Flavobacterium sp. 7E]